MPPTKVMVLMKSRLSEFLEALNPDYDLFLPAKKDDSVQYLPYKQGIVPEFSPQPVFPIKEVFFDKREVLMTWESGKIAVPNINGKPKLLFGLRLCDLNAVRKQDIAFSGDFSDPYYIKRRENTLLIGYHCDKAPSENCFCGSMKLTDFFDLMLYEKDDNFRVEIGSEKGEKLVSQFQKFFIPGKGAITRKDREIKGLRTLDYSGIAGSELHNAWDKLVSLCLSCSACTALCPTCYCHEIHDDMNALDMNAGQRIREWSSCQLQSFTRIAGDLVFRKERRDRFLHRIFHQLLYFREKNGENLCVGCGRCISFCPNRIDFVRALNEISSKRK